MLNDRLKKKYFLLQFNSPLLGLLQQTGFFGQLYLQLLRPG
jgi:hypothetical protein